MKKRGQFYLLSAIIIISIIIGFSAISTYTRQSTEIVVFDLADELEIESANVLEFGRLPGNINSEDFDNFVSDFIERYSDYVGEDKIISFVFGNSEGVNSIEYREVESEVKWGNTIIKIKKKEKIVESGEGDIEVNNNKAAITFDDKEYEVELKPGENFFFVISQNIEGETHSTKSKRVELIDS